MCCRGYTAKKQVTVAMAFIKCTKNEQGLKEPEDVPEENQNANKNQEQYIQSEGKGRKKRKRNTKMRRPVVNSPWLNFCSCYRYIIRSTDDDATESFRKKSLPERTTLMAAAYAEFKTMVKAKNKGQDVSSKELLGKLYEYGWDYKGDGKMEWQLWADFDKK